jgi:hypothetical protein
MTGCTALAPPPMVARHASPAPMPDGTLSLSLVLGFAMSGFFEFGIGAEVRAAMQVSSDVEAGVGLGFGTADIGVDPQDASLGDRIPARTVRMLSLRAYTTITPLDTERVAFTTGLGVNALSIGLVSLTLDLTSTVGYTNDALVPYGTVGLAVSIPVREGLEFGHPLAQPRSGIYGLLLGGLGIPEDGHFLSLEAGLAADLRDSKLGVLSASLAERWSKRERLP